MSSQRIALVITALALTYFFCAVANDDFCFYAAGRNDRGFLMIPPPEEFSNVSVPRPIGYHPLLHRNITHIAAGDTHSLALDDTGSPFVFGQNKYGSLGIGSSQTDIYLPISLTASDAFNQKMFVHATAEKDVTYLQDSHGNMFFCGVNNLHEITLSEFNRPFPYNPLNQILKQVSVGFTLNNRRHTLLVTQSGELFSYGHNNAGELLVGYSSEREYEPLQVNITHVDQVAAGAEFSLFLTSEGEVFGGGSNVYGNLGIGNITTNQHTPVQVNISGALEGKIFSRISVGFHHSLLLSIEGEIYSFGLGMHGQLGIDSYDNKYDPVRILDTHIGSPKYVAISSGFAHNLALTAEGEVIAWGFNRFGQVGLGHELCPLPQRVSLDTQGQANTTIKQISAGSAHNLLLTQDGKIMVFGDNSVGQLGILTSIIQKQSTPVLLTNSSTNNQISAVSVSGKSDHFLILEKQGRVFSIGSNEHGELGDGTETSRRQVRQIFSTLGSGFKVSTGDSHSIIISTDGKAYGFGYNTFGATGSSEISDSISTPKLISSPSTFIDVACGAAHSILLGSNSKVYSFGRNEAGQLGIGFSDPQYKPVLVNTSCVKNHNIISISAGDQHNVLLTNRGSVVAFGSNNAGQLALGPDITVQPIPIRLKQLDDHFIISISAGSLHTLFLTQSGKVLVTGSNQYGQCSGLESEYFFAQDISSFFSGKRVITVSAGSFHSLILTKEHEVYAFGWNEWGNLGIGNFSNQHSPVLVNTSFISSRESMNIIGGKYLSFFSTCPDIECFGLSHRHPLICSQHGACTAQDHCECDFGYSGDECSLPVCFGPGSNGSSGSCANHGVCTSPNNCNCDDGYHGDDCSRFNCGKEIFDSTVVCSQHGECTAPNHCECDDGFHGFICSHEMQCNGIGFSNPNVCSKHGTCMDGICICSPHWRWKGSNCENDMLIIVLVVCGVVAFLFVSFICICCLISCKEFFRRKKAESKEKSTKKLLEGFIHDNEMDLLDEDSQRARLIMRKSMLEVDFSELSDFQKIGSGGSGAILFSAAWNDSRVAVKVFKSGLIGGDQFYEEFEHEVSLMSSLRHRNIINFFGCSLNYPRIAIIMELCPGSLESKIVSRSFEKLSHHEKLRMLLDITEGMKYLHSRDVIHRDLKCANVLVDEHGVCKITDFGLSKYTKDEIAVNHTVGIGTSYYSAPEVVRGDGKYTETVDVYAFGILAMEMLLGRMCPFPGNVSNKLAVQQNAVRESSFRPNIQELAENYQFLGWVLEQCWNEDPKARPPFRDISKILKSSMIDST